MEPTTNQTRLSLCNVTTEGRLFEVAVCHIKDGEARWSTKTPTTAPLLMTAYQALEVIPEVDPAIIIQE